MSCPVSTYMVTPVFILRGVGRRVHLVAPHDKDPPPLGGVGLTVPVEFEFFGGQQRGHGVRRVPPIANVGHVVQPPMGLPRAIRNLGRLPRLQFPIVGVGAEHA